MKKVAKSLFLAVLLLLFLSACSQPQEEPSAEEPAPVEEVPAAEEEAPAAEEEVPAEEPPAEEEAPAEEEPPAEEEAPPEEETPLAEEPVGTSLRFLMPDFTDVPRVQEDIAAAAEDLGLDAFVELVPPDIYFEMLRDQIEAGVPPDLAVLSPEDALQLANEGYVLPVSDFIDPTQFANGLPGNPFANTAFVLPIDPELCTLFAGVLATGNEIEAFALLEQLALRVDNRCTIIPIPYPEPPPPDVIGELATWVPNDPLILEAVSALEPILNEEGATINTARAVKLQEPVEPEEFEFSEIFEVTYLAPLALNSSESDDGQIVGVIMLDAEYGEEPPGLPPGPYAMRLIPSEGIVVYIGADGQEYPFEILEYEPDELTVGFPTAGIDLGSKDCRVRTWWGWATVPCGWLGR